MTPKEQYEARKAERQRRREAEETLGRSDNTQWMILEMLDRFVVAVERIADSLDRKREEKR